MTRAIETLLDGLSFAEAPRWHGDALVFSDIHANRVLRLDDSGEVSVLAELDQPVSGLGWLPDGRMLMVAMHDRKIVRQEHDGRLVDYADLAHIATFHANDMIVSLDGTAYVGNFGFPIAPLGTPCTAKLARVGADGTVDVVADELWFPNGMAITPDGRTLIVAETAACRVTAFDILDDGKLGERRLWAEFPDSHMPDGMCLDDAGAAWIALPLQKRFVRVAEGGAILETIEMEDKALACVLGGTDRRTLYMATADETEPAAAIAHPSAAIRATRVDVAGAGLP